MLPTEARLLREIKKKKELKELSDQFVREELDAYFRRNPGARKFLERPRSGKYKKIVKEVRARLRRASGLFHGTTLESHPSTRERLSIYGTLYAQLWELAGQPKIILDLGCGLNPLSFPHLGLKDVTYYAYDINGKDISLVNKFFREKKVKGKALAEDVAKTKTFPVADIAFLFKMTDILDRKKGHKKTEEVIRRVPAKFVVVSFPTITMSGRPMNFPRRRWIELMCRRLNFPFRVLEFSRELFYVIEK